MPYKFCSYKIACHPVMPFRSLAPCKRLYQNYVHYVHCVYLFTIFDLDNFLTIWKLTVKSKIVLTNPPHPKPTYTVPRPTYAMPNTYSHNT